MYGPYPIYPPSSGGGAGFLDPVTRDMFWLYTAVDDGTNWTIVIAQRKYSQVPLNLTTCIFPHDGADMEGDVLVDDNFYYVLAFNGPGYSRWYKFSRDDGSLQGQVGNLSGDDLRLSGEACLDDNGHIIHIQGAQIVVIETDSMTIVGGGSLPYTCAPPLGLAAGSGGLTWAYCSNGFSAAIASIDTSDPISPVVTSYPLASPTLGGIIYYAEQNCLIYWADLNTLQKWSCASHSVIQSVSNPGAAGYFGPVAGNYFANDIDLYSPVTLKKVLTAKGYNPLLPGYNNLGIDFGQWSDGGGVIWLQADDGNVYGAAVQPSTGIPHGANCNNYENGGALSPNNPPGCGLLLGEMV